MAAIDYDKAYKDFMAIGTSANAGWQAGNKQSFGYGILDSLGGKSTKTYYLNAIEAPLIGFWQSDAEMALRGNRPEVSEEFKQFLIALGMDQQNPLKQELFKKGFDAAFKDPAELKDPARMYSAIEAGLVAVAGSREKYLELYAKSFPYDPSKPPTPIDQLPPVLQQHERDWQQIEQIKKDQPDVTPYVDGNGQVTTHGGDAGKAKADCLTEKLEGKITDVDACVRDKLAQPAP